MKTRTHENDRQAGSVLFFAMVALSVLGFLSLGFLVTVGPETGEFRGTYVREAKLPGAAAPAAAMSEAAAVGLDEVAVVPAMADPVFEPVSSLPADDSDFDAGN